MMDAKIGFWLETDNQKACEIARLAGYDLVVIDGEHGIFDHAAIDRLVPFCQGLGLKVYVRVSEASRPEIQMALDVGTNGVILPQIKDLAHAREVTRYAKYPPLGDRGVGYSRTQAYGTATNDFIRQENDDRTCFAMIETAGAFTEAAAIAALPCVDGLFIGPADLSLARGRGVFTASVEDIADMVHLAATARAVGKPWAAAAGHRDYRAEALRHQPSFVTAADDLSALYAGFESLLAR